MKFTLNELNEAKSLSLIAESKFSGKKAFLIARLMKKLQEEYDTYQTARRSLVIKYAEKDEKGEPIIDAGGNVRISDSNMAKLNKEYEELVSTEVEIDAEPIDAEWLDDIELSPNQIAELMPFIKM